MQASRGRRCCCSIALLWLVFALASPAIGDALVPLPPQPPGVAWPTEAWPTGPLPDDLDRDAFEAGVEKIFASISRSGAPDTRALLVVQEGRIVYERYAQGFGPDSRFQSWSMAKSVTNALTGVLVHQGRLDIEAPANVPEWSEPGDPRGTITLQQMLEMRTGIDNGDGFGGGDMANAFVAHLMFGAGAHSPAAFAADRPLVHPIGERWAYSTGTSILIARVCGDLIGGGAQGTMDFMRRELLLPIGMKSGQPEFAQSGEFFGGSFFHATARDWARFGYLYLRDGVWDGRRILPEGWVDYSRTPNPAVNNAVHGAQFWINTAEETPENQWKPLPGGPSSAFLAEGAGFQMVAMVPDKDLVAVRLGVDQGTPYPAVKEPFGPLISAFPDRP